MLVALSNAVKVESVPLNFDQFLLGATSADFGPAASREDRVSTWCDFHSRAYDDAGPEPIQHN